ncbi:MAG: 50S ribosomal protein L21 [Gammaproteobacteria bacterium]|nr:50S ribosomal protein L21 [Gammaproteobacteria bacterium]
MYAVIECGGKQHRVIEGESLKVEKLDVATGDTLQLDQVLMLGAGESVQIGTPYLQGKQVTAEVVAHGRHPKINIVKFRRRKHHRKQMGHRQWFTEIKIVSIDGKGGASKAAAKPASTAPAAKSGGDDLTRISGVGPVIVEKLAENGITTFAQIAAFSAADVEAMDEKLNFKGRIDRDNWIEQAKQLMQ